MKKPQNDYTHVTDEEILYLSNISGKITGLKDVVIWIGPSPQGYRIKVSNVPDRSDRNNCFTITIPDYKVLGEINKSFINPHMLSKIIEFIRINQENIVSFSDLKMTVDELLEKIIPVG